jgi:glycosyltransferase involved in cell wall biosynthesis
MRQQSAKISVIIPVYNAENTVGAILEKLISQKYKDIEIIAVNDGSTDGSLKVLQKFADKDKRIIIIDQKNSGVSAARNIAVKKAVGEYITFVDSDDDISYNLIEILASNITENSDFIMCGMSINEKELVAKDAYYDNKVQITKYILQSLLTKNLLYGPCCKLFRRSIIEDYKIKFPAKIDYGEDTIFVLNYLRYVNSIIVISKILYIYNLRPTGLSINNSNNYSFRKARSRSLKIFIKDNNSVKCYILYFLIRLRWSLSFIKAFIKDNNPLSGLI